MPEGVAKSIVAADLLRSLTEANVQDVVAVPDTHQRTLIDALEAQTAIRFLQASSEDEGVTICAGLIVGGRRPLLQIQHAGLYACVNNLRGMGIDGGFPIVLLVGLLGRDPAKLPRENFGSMVRLAQPLLDALEVPVYVIDREADLHYLPSAYVEAEARGGPVALLLGAETA